MRTLQIYTNVSQINVCNFVENIKALKHLVYTICPGCELIPRFWYN